ncbi:MAG: copper resistance protein B [Bacteroidota bacterium]
MKSNRMNWIVGAVLMLGLSCASAEEPAAMPEMDHSRMDHGSVPAAAEAVHDMSSTDQGGMSSGPPRMQGGSAPPDARDPNAYSDGYVFAPMSGSHMMGDEHHFYSLLVDRLERVRTSDNSSASYDLQAWYGRDYDRAVLKAEGERDGGELQHARTELLWGHALAAYWDTQLGVRYDGGAEPSRNWLAFGVQGLAPYWFETEITAYFGEQGRTALRFAAEYELLLTQKLILQPRLEANIFGKRDAERALGSGLSDAAAGVRLRYEIRRELAPYVGIERSGKFGTTADYARDAGEDTHDTRLVAGVRFWF